MEWITLIIASHVHFGDGVDNPQGVLALLRQNVPVYNIYLICISPVSRNLLEIIHSVHMNKPGVLNASSRLIAVTQGKREAYVFIQSLTEEWLNKSNGSDLENFKSYLQKGLFL